MVSLSETAIPEGQSKMSKRGLCRYPNSSDTDIHSLSLSCIHLTGTGPIREYPYSPLYFFLQETTFILIKL